MDHLGLAGIVARRSGAEVAALDALAPWAANYGQNMAADDAFADAIMSRHGIPEDVRYALRAVAGAFRAWGAPVEVTRLLRDGETLDLRDRSLRILHRPGHSPSDTVLVDEERGYALAGDHLLKHISSNPLIARPLDGEDSERPQALVTYLDSLRRTRELDLELLLPGHGQPVDDHRALIDERFRLHARRAEKLRRLIEEHPRTAYELAHSLWGNVAVTQAYLTLSEILGHTDLLLNEGRVREVVGEDGVARFEAQ
jgi:glyoxylase-like metal-dependent hydrolase (beta-lactamase superfamily II)